MAKAQTATPSPVGDVPAADGLPSPAAIVEREGRQRPLAIWTSVALAVVTAAAVILENVMAGSVPTLNQTHLIDTFGAALAGTPAPPSYYRAVAEWKLDHVAVNALAATLRAATYLLAVPLVLLLMRGARDRGAPIARFLQPMVIVGALLMALGPIAVAIGEPGINHAARDAGFTPGAIRDAYTNSSLIYLRIPSGIGSLFLGVPLAFAAMHAWRTGLVPQLLGYMGVLVGIIVVLPFEPTGLLRAFWFSAVAFVLSGRFGDGLPEAWRTGLAVLPPLRQPAPAREKKTRK